MKRAFAYLKNAQRRMIGISLPIEHWQTERYIPLLPNELIASLKFVNATELIGAERCPAEHGTFPPTRLTDEGLESAATYLKQLIRLKYRGHHESLMDLYSRYDPDRDVFDRIASGTLTSSFLFPNDGTITPESKARSDIRSIFSEINKALENANYRRLSPRDIQRAVGAASHWGVRLRIRFSSFRRLQVFARGDILTRRKVRHWRALFLLREVEVPIYQRLVVIFWPKEVQHFNEPLDPNRLHVRMFKNVPKADIDMMLPGTQVRLNWLDRGMIGIPTLWGIFMMSSKLVKSIWVLAFLGTLKILSSTFLYVAIVIATAFYGIKSFFSYSTAKRRYLLDVTRNLYYQNLDNNLGALLRIEEEAEQQEVCEAILAYFVLISNQQNAGANHQAVGNDEIDSRAEKYLQEILGTPIDFDARDALNDLVKLGAIYHDGTGWRAKSPDELQVL